MRAASNLPVLDEGWVLGSDVLCEALTVTQLWSRYKKTIIGEEKYD